ncbi:MAG: F0F1 ATP synthase subunit B [Acidocella sp.]|nr:F0F1 ATP synthase subunit B [Acidocella sp.]
MQYEAMSAVPWAHGAFWVFIAIVIFAGLAGRKIAKALTNMLDARTEGVRLALDEAAALKREAEAMLAEAKAAQAQARKDAADILAYARAEAARITAALAAEAQASAARRERMALERIGAAEAQALVDVRNVAIDIATAASAAMLRDGLDSGADAAMIDHAIAGIPAALRQPI